MHSSVARLEIVCACIRVCCVSVEERIHARNLSARKLGAVEYPGQRARCNLHKATDRQTYGTHLNWIQTQSAVFCRSDLAARKEGDEEPLHLELSGRELRMKPQCNM